VLVFGGGGGERGAEAEGVVCGNRSLRRVRLSLPVVVGGVSFAYGVWGGGSVGGRAD